MFVSHIRNEQLSLPETFLTQIAAHPLNETLFLHLNIWISAITERFTEHSCPNGSKERNAYLQIHATLFELAIHLSIWGQFSQPITSRCDQTAYICNKYRIIECEKVT